jgi:hypothetical protein
MHCLALHLRVGRGGRIGIGIGWQGPIFPAVFGGDCGEDRHVIGDLLVAVCGELTLLLVVFHLQRRQLILKLGCAASELGHDEPLACKLLRGAKLRRLTKYIFRKTIFFKIFFMSIDLSLQQIQY